MLRVLNETPPGVKVGASLIWVQVLAEDGEQAARTAAEHFQHPGLRHFYDPDQLAAREMAAVLGGMGSYAWDTYLVFASGATWGDQPPLPADWVHQLDRAAWAPAERRRWGEALVRAIAQMMDKATGSRLP